MLVLWSFPSRTRLAFALASVLVALKCMLYLVLDFSPDLFESHSRRICSGKCAVKCSFGIKYSSGHFVAHVAEIFSRLFCAVLYPRGDFFQCARHATAEVVARLTFTTFTALTTGILVLYSTFSTSTRALRIWLLRAWKKNYVGNTKCTQNV